MRVPSLAKHENERRCNDLLVFSFLLCVFGSTEESEPKNSSLHFSSQLCETSRSLLSFLLPMAPSAATFSAPAPESDAPGIRRRVGIAMLPSKVSPGSVFQGEGDIGRLVLDCSQTPNAFFFPFSTLLLKKKKKTLSNPLSFPPKNSGTKKKQAAKHLRPELIEAVGKAGYEIVPVVPGKLAEAGRLDALLHKIRTPGKR